MSQYPPTFLAKPPKQQSSPAAPREKITVPAGSYVLAVTQSAMFDKRAFEAPEEFKPDRNWYHQVHFGYGAHECLGRYVGGVMIPEMVRQLMVRPDLKADGNIDYEGGHLPQKYSLSWTEQKTNQL